ncbi:hypothetical protein ACFE04_002419 [Oxalis oulophora]
MATTTSSILILILLTVMSFTVTNAAKHHSSHVSPSPAPTAVDCTSVVMNMVDCLTYVQNGSTLPKPEKTCCTGLKTVLDTNAECLCEAFKNTASYGIVLDVQKAMSLPSACKITSPAAPTCGSLISVAPASAPGMAPSAAAGAPSGSSQAAPNSPPSSAPSMLSFSVGSVVIGLVAVLLSIS